jgi:hypothetical protein
LMASFLRFGGRFGGGLRGHGAFGCALRHWWARLRWVFL